MLKVFLNALCWCQESKKHFKTWWFFVKWFLQYHDKIMTHNDQIMQTIFSKDISYDITSYYWTQSKSWWIGWTDQLQFQLPAVHISKHFATKQFSIKCRTQGIYQTWKWRRGKKWTYNVSLWWMIVNYFSAMPIYSEVWSAAVDGGGSKLWMLEDNEDNQREDCSRKRTNSLFSFLHLRHISCCCCWTGDQCNCITSCNLLLVAPCLVPCSN